MYCDAKYQQAYEALNEKRYILERELKILKIEYGIVLPCIKDERFLFGRGGVLDKNKKFVTESEHRAGSGKHRMMEGYFVEDSDIVNTHDTEKILYFGGYWKHWGHFLAEQISRLWYALEYDCARLKVAYIKFDTNEIDGNFLRFLELLNIPREHMICIERPTRFAEVILPERCVCINDYCTKEYKQIFNRVSENVLKHKITDQHPIEKVYFTRRQFQRTNFVERGESIIERIFQEDGYQVISPEKCSLDEQIMIINTAKQIAALSGTIPHNLMFYLGNDGGGGGAAN